MCRSRGKSLFAAAASLWRLCASGGAFMTTMMGQAGRELAIDARASPALSRFVKFEVVPFLPAPLTPQINRSLAFPRWRYGCEYLAPATPWATCDRLLQQAPRGLDLGITDALPFAHCRQPLR
jgi:hypothetical protein